MKTKMNNNLIRLSVAAITVLMSAAVPAMAYDKNSMAYAGSEYQAARDRLEILNVFVEESMLYSAPEVAEDIEAYEIRGAEERLENLSITTEASVCYQAPVEDDDAEAYEVAAAKERLEVLARAIEESVKF